MDYFLTNLWALWACVSIVCLVMELTSGDCFLLCISIGSAVTALVAVIGGGIYAQLIALSAVSLFSLFAIRPWLVKKIHSSGEKRASNVEAMLNREGKVSQDIPENGFGRVALDGDDWKAKSTDGSAIPSGTRVKVSHVESTIITVCKI